MADRQSGGSSALLVLLAFVLTLSGSASRAATPEVALEAIDYCLSKLRPAVDVGYERIASRCPQLARHLEESGWSRWLPRDWKRTGNDLTAGGLRELRALLSRETGTSTEAAHRPSIAGLSAALAELAQADDVRDGWWPRTKEWLRDVFERRARESDEDWLSRLIGQNGLSQTVIEIVSYVALLLVVVLAGIIVLNELRVGGVSGRLRARLKALRAVKVAAGPEDGVLSWDAVQAVPLTQRPRMLLETIVARLMRDSRLPGARGLTARELARAAQLSDEQDREHLAKLAGTSERVRFSNAPVPADEIARAVENGRTLLERLSTGGLEGGS
jgi:hypothetical protein